MGRERVLFVKVGLGASWFEIHSTSRAPPTGSRLPSLLSSSLLHSGSRKCTRGRQEPSLFLQRTSGVPNYIDLFLTNEPTTWHDREASQPVLGSSGSSPVQPPQCIRTSPPHPASCTGWASASVGGARRPTDMRTSAKRDPWVGSGRTSRCKRLQGFWTCPEVFRRSPRRFRTHRGSNLPVLTPQTWRTHYIACPSIILASFALKLPANVTKGPDRSCL